jgi:hypothetical protein
MMFAIGFDFQTTALQTWLRDLAACFLREVCQKRPALIKRGRRECRALDAPAAWRAEKQPHQQ